MMGTSDSMFKMAAVADMRTETMERHKKHLLAEVRAFRGEDTMFYDSHVVDAWAAAKGFSVERGVLPHAVTVHMWADGMTYSVTFPAAELEKS